jgi:predicted alpha/beta superfamily hydrolase
MDASAEPSGRSVYLQSDADNQALDHNPRYRIHRSFRSAFLPTSRDIFVYLPQAYEEQPNRNFPVFYLHDGQNLFDGRLSYIKNSTWQAHITADALTAAGEIEPVILVGIANPGVERMLEYTPTTDFRLGGGKGPLYGQLLTQELLPFIGARYRTVQGPQNTALGGSSLGGLISLWLAMEYPQTFGKLAVISPSIWWDHRSILSIVKNTPPNLKQRIWFDIGTSEGEQPVRDAELLYRLLLRRGWKDNDTLAYRVIPQGIHTESAWAARFGNILRFLFSR